MFLSLKNPRKCPTIQLYTALKLYIFWAMMSPCMRPLVLLVACAAWACGAEGSAAPRSVYISGMDFVLRSTGARVVLGGPNVVVKGPPYLPSVSGDTYCSDVVNTLCQSHGNCSSCQTFNEHDVDHIQSRGWNFIRLGVVWAGAQPRRKRARPRFRRAPPCTSTC